MKKFNINRSPFLKLALAFIKDCPGCNKKEIVDGVPGCRSRRGIARRYAAIDKLVENDLIVNQYISGNKYSFVIRNSNPKAYNLLKDRSRWCQGGYAKDDQGLIVNTQHESAVQFCLVGSIHKTYPQIGYNPELNHLYNISAMNNDVTNGGVVPFNDSHSYEDVMKFLKAANL